MLHLKKLNWPLVCIQFLLVECFLGIAPVACPVPDPGLVAAALGTLPPPNSFGPLSFARLADDPAAGLTKCHV